MARRWALGGAGVPLELLYMKILHIDFIIYIFELIAILTFMLRLIRPGSYPATSWLTTGLRFVVVPLILFQLYLFF